MKMTDSEGRPAIPENWIHSRVTLAEIEGPNKAKDLIAPADCAEWRAFKSQIGQDDEVWYFTSPAESFAHCAGRVGYLILRNGEQLDNFVAVMN